MNFVKQFAIDDQLYSHFKREWEAVKYLEPEDSIDAIDPALSDVLHYINTNYGVTSLYSCSGQSFSMGQIEKHFGFSKKAREFVPDSSGYMLLVYTVEGVDAIELILENLINIKSLRIEFVSPFTDIFDGVSEKGQRVDFRGVVIRWKTKDLSLVMKALLQRRFQETEEEFEQRIKLLIELDEAAHLEAGKTYYLKRYGERK
jgi:hypothetical protein